MAYMVKLLLIFSIGFDSVFIRLSLPTNTILENSGEIFAVFKHEMRVQENFVIKTTFLAIFRTL